ncbi:hypothetical protein PM3016_450 [Paenibacillus mucilaginosus 3016]|uniref:Uncharacterized protein n=2 Tax=Paenibacillus mucilaginosus TaxID=61624 RepID=H6NSJ9_9BACL|nr:hypothetical protein PM3016_450 [Paenibacillus mucilaginosus 3016]WFA16326.1 hypothetical protein ERY13_02385 [Paenibacillus mucilaginosus]
MVYTILCQRKARYVCRTGISFLPQGKAIWETIPDQVSGKEAMGMNSAPITFEFESRKAALLAMDTMEELGYRTALHDEPQKPLLHVIVDKGDITSALEIAEAHGGRLIETADFPNEPAVFAMAYDPDGGIIIPAHLVGPDEVDISAAAYGGGPGSAYTNEDDDTFDPSREDYNGFDAGIHL